MKGVIRYYCSMSSFLQRYGAWAAALVLLSVNGLIWFGVLRAHPPSGSGMLTVSFLDVGQGDAIYIEGPNGNQILVDGGAGPSVLRELGAVMPFYDRSIDAVVGTHPDKDHIGGLSSVLARYDVRFFIDPGLPNDTAAWRALETAVRERGVERKTARRGMKVVLGGGAVLDILFPDRDMAGADTNDASIVARLSFSNQSFLLTGDSPKKIEEYLVRSNAEVLASDVLKVGHHGSHTSTGERFLAAVRPSYAIISAGKDNSYGHPHKEVLDLLARFGIHVESTAERGRITFKTDGKTLTLERK